MNQRIKLRSAAFLQVAESNKFQKWYTFILLEGVYCILSVQEILS